ncbi:MAG: 4Fe-4S binding protein [Candidatus Aenigmarchaeota archaeon]|nr:4Fe-4S binding protein [Candidatus Aenigmarchaeota archaeon]
MAAWKNEKEINYDNRMAPVALQEAQAFKCRLFRPKIDIKMCKKCMICVVACPDNCIEVSESGKPAIIYSNCKGCLICLRECPYGAISEEREQ